MRQSEPRKGIIPLVIPLQYLIEQQDGGLSTTSPILIPPRGEDWKLEESRLKAVKDDGMITDARGVNYRITKLTASSKPQEKRGTEIQ